MKNIDNSWEFTPEWSGEFLKGEGTSQPVRLPHTVKELPLHYIDPKDYQMVCGYRRHLAYDPAWAGKKVFLQFDGAAHIADVYVNGTLLGHHGSGYTAFRIDATDALREGDNLIAVRLDTTENPAVPPFGFVIDYLTYGGIYRDVWVDVRNPEYIEDAWVYTPDLHSAVLELKASMNGLKALLSIQDENGKVIARKEGDASEKITVHVENTESWTPEHPNLYKAVITLKKGDETVDEVTRTFGFRTVSVDKDNILLNGKPVFLRGLNRHQCWPYVGYAAPKRLQVEDARILKEELGVNAVRTSHYPQSHYFLDACDRMGLLVFTEIPGWQHVSKDKDWRDQCVKNVEEMVIQYRQHPSIILWGVRVNESQDDEELYTRTNAMAHKLDHTRPTSGVRYLEKSQLLEDVYAFNDFSHSGNNPGCRKKADVTKDTDKPLLISEANGHMFPTKMYDNSERRQEHALRHARVLDAALSEGHHAGCFQWCMFDYATHQDFGSGDRVCYHGVMDMFRNPKPAAALYASQQETTPVLEVTSSMDIGDYPAGMIGDVACFSNADTVKLYKNDVYVNDFHSTSEGLKHGPMMIDDTVGHLLESQEGMDEKEAKLIRSCLLDMKKNNINKLPASTMAKLGYAMMKYHLKFEDGYRLYQTYIGNWGGEATRWRFDAVKDGKVAASVTKAPSAKLHLDVRTSGNELLEGDVYDMTAVRIRILDEYNNQAFYSQVPVRFSVSGALELVGDDVCTAEGGACGTYLRTTGEKGEAVLKIETTVTDPVEIRFEVK